MAQAVVRPPAAGQGQAARRPDRLRQPVPVQHDAAPDALMRFRKWLGHRRLRAFRAPIYIHWSVFAIAGVLAIGSRGDPVYAVIAILSYFAIILIHECGHAWVAR